LLIGDGPQRAAVEQRIRALGLDDRVRVTGLLQDVRPCIAACDVMVIPSRKVETFSIAALESMALGKPMVMTDIGGARELVRPGEHGWLVPPGEVPALASALRRMQDPQARRRMGEAAAQHVRRHFPQETMARAYERALRSLLGEPVSLGSGWAMRS
jgi:glycosyltransferase involved in cell wall biosynthesis